MADLMRCPDCGSVFTARMPMHACAPRKYNKHHVGRVRIEAAKVLTRCLGFEVNPEDISPATGRNRSDWRMDVYRWELFARDLRFGGEGYPVVAGCWECLTEFVKLAKRHGCYIKDGEVMVKTAESTKGV